MYLCSLKSGIKFFVIQLTTQNYLYLSCDILDAVSFTNSGLLVLYMYYFICVKLLLFFDFILLLFFWWRFLTRKGIINLIKYADWPTSTIIKKADLLKMTHFNWIHIIWLPGAQGKSEKWNRFNFQCFGGLNEWSSQFGFWICSALHLFSPVSF